jgi:hypothetical protein
MRSAYSVHPEFGWPNLRRRAGLALAFIVFGSIAGASGIVVQMAGDGPTDAGRAVIAAIPLNPSATLSTVVLPASPVVSASGQSASPSNTAQAVDAIAAVVTAPPTASAIEPPQKPVAASKKSQKTARSQNRRERGWYDASARRQQYADYGRGRSYGNERPSSSW